MLVSRFAVAVGLVMTLGVACSPKLTTPLPGRLLNRQVVLYTNKGDIRLKLYDDTPLHRENFLKLVRSRYYDGVLFHRVIEKFMIQAGDPKSKQAADTAKLGNGGPGYTIPSEIKATHFHKKGVLAAARTGDQVNPERASSGSQFYIVQGRVFNDAGLDSVETYRLKGRKIPPEQREVYKTIGGAPHLDQSYTIFGEVVAGLDIVDSIAAAKTSRADRPLKNLIIKKARLIQP